MKRFENNIRSFQVTVATTISGENTIASGSPILPLNNEIFIGLDNGNKLLCLAIDSLGRFIILSYNQYAKLIMNNSITEFSNLPSTANNSVNSTLTSKSIPMRNGAADL